MDGNLEMLVRMPAPVRFIDRLTIKVGRSGAKNEVYKSWNKWPPAIEYTCFPVKSFEI